MTVEQAIAILNDRRYDGRSTWDKAAALGRPVVTDGARWITHFEAVSVARALLATEEAAGRRMPPAPSLADAVRTLADRRHRGVSDWRIDPEQPGHAWSSAGPLAAGEAIAAAESYARHRSPE